MLADFAEAFGFAGAEEAASKGRVTLEPDADPTGAVLTEEAVAGTTILVCTDRPHASELILRRVPEYTSPVGDARPAGAKISEAYLR